MVMNGQKVRRVGMPVGVSCGHIRLRGVGRPGIGSKLNRGGVCLAGAGKREAGDYRVYVRETKGAISREFYFLFTIKLHGESVTGIAPQRRADFRFE